MDLFLHIGSLLSLPTYKVTLNFICFNKFYEFFLRFFNNKSSVHRSIQSTLVLFFPLSFSLLSHPFSLSLILNKFLFSFVSSSSFFFYPRAPQLCILIPAFLLFFTSPIFWIYLLFYLVEGVSDLSFSECFFVVEPLYPSLCISLLRYLFPWFPVCTIECSD